MNIKVRPNKNALMNGYINCTQKSRKTCKIKEERGLTLIALIVMTIILVILSAVAIRGITGDEGIIVGTETATENYVIEQYREQIQQLVQSIILKDSLVGKITTVTSMAEDMEEEDWIKSAVPNEENGDIIVTVDAGYIYQVIYDEETGETDVEYVGKEDGTEMLTLTARYDKSTGIIEAQASCDGGIARIELIYKGETVQEVTSDTANFEVEETGWYQVKATANNGKTRYVNVRVTGKLEGPIIAITSNGEQENGWYGKDNVPVEVTISTENAETVGIYYKKNTDTDYTYVEGKSTVLTINTAGRTVIYAYAVDASGAESEISSLEVKYDNVAPTIGAAALSPEVPASGWHTTDVEISLPDMSDSNSGIAGFYYWEVIDEAEPTEEEKTYISGTGKTITVQSEGEKVISFQAKDNAGNLSGITTITVKKDSVEPNDFTPTITNEKSTGFTINARTEDSTSGIAGYYFYVDGELKNSEINTSGTYEVTGVSPNKSYAIYAEAVDVAGNRKKSTSITVATKGELYAPQISISGADQVNGYYTGNVTVTIQDSAEEDVTGATQIRYTVTGANQIAETTVNGRTATFTITTDGTSTITAQAVSSTGNVSETSTQTLSKDATPPSTASITAGTVDKTTIEVTANGQDATSGIESYEFQYSTTSSTDGFTKAEEVQNTSNSCTYKYQNLASNTTYYLRVIVKDRVGNTTASTAVSAKTKTAELNFEEMTDEEIEEERSKYVNYTPTVGSFTSEGRYNGNTNQTFETITSLKWRIFEVDKENNKLILISDTTANEGFSLQGANGYNNGVLLMNNACKAMYSNSSLGATARSLKLEDVERHSTFDKTSYYDPTIINADGGKVWYGGQYGKGRSQGYYPNIFAQEKTGAPRGTFGTKYGQSEQDSYITGSSKGTSSYKATYTGYEYEISTQYMTQDYVELFRYEPNTTTNLSNYWLATRAVLPDTIVTVFYDMYYIFNGHLTQHYLYNANNNNYEPFSYAIRPVVEIDLSKVNIVATGDGSSDNPYSIVAK